MLRFSTLLLSFLFALNSYAQTPTNILVTNSKADAVMKGNYDPALLAPGAIVSHTDAARDLQNLINSDTLKKNIIKLATFRNRNTGADTVSNVTGIGAARRWVHREFESYSNQTGGRLIPAYFQFDQLICSQPQHRNIMAVLPGADTSDKSIVIVEAHIDSRNKDLCDTTESAEGIEDNASGTALVMELARVMSGRTYKNTIVFLIVISEEQGLYGANAFAVYCKNEGIGIKAVLNNDVVGGVICGKTSSPPSCPGYNDVDSTQVRFFSTGSTFSDHKNLCRFIKLEYQEELLQYVTVPMAVTIMAGEDRIGRGGDHIPFRQAGFTSMRVTAANEHGDASNSPGYDDRQHTTSDVLGVDTDNDMVVDSFFVDFNYLGRNAAINGNAIAMAAIGPKKPAFTLSQSTDQKLKVTITDQKQYLKYRVGVRTGTNNDFDTIYTITALTDSFTVVLNKSTFVSVASVDGNGVESLFATEQRLLVSGLGENIAPKYGIELLANVPNPFDEATTIGFIVNKNFDYKDAAVVITDLQGRIVKQMPVVIKEGVNEVIYEHGYNTTGIFLYQLIIDGKVIDTRRMVFTAN